MSIWKDMFGKRSWFGVMITILTVLLALAVGALAVTGGLISPANTWILVCVVWGLAGFVTGRYAQSGGERWLARGSVSLLITMLLFWGVGLTASDPTRSNVAACFWYIGSAFAGMFAAAALPGGSKRKTGKRRPKRRR